MGKKETSKFISLILRHRPEAAGIVLDEHGWADVDELIRGINGAGRHRLDRELLEEIVREDEKQRYSFNEDHTLIRANQGHSIPVDVELKQMAPPDILFHGTGKKSMRSIEKEGLLPMSRLYVHLSKDVKTAKTVGSRHGTPIVYKVRAGAMARDGYKFYLSANGVWLTKSVPVEYLSQHK
jgi:putative RNA 2'-phosphotransferase